MTKKFRKAFDDDDGDDEFWDEADGTTADVEVDGVSFAPMFTGLLDHNGKQILRHPVVIRMGFYPERSKFHAPTLYESPYPGSGAIVGWEYASDD